MGRSLCHLPHLTSKSGSWRRPSNPHTGQQLWTHLQSPPKLNAQAARVGPNEALDPTPIPPLQSAQILHLPRNPLAPRSQPRRIRQSVHRPTAPRSTAVHPLLPQGQQDTNKKIFAGRILVRLTLLFPSAPACLMPSAVRWVPSVT